MLGAVRAQSCNPYSGETSTRTEKGFIIGSLTGSMQHWQGKGQHDLKGLFLPSGVPSKSKYTYSCGCGIALHTLYHSAASYSSLCRVFLHLFILCLLWEASGHLNALCLFKSVPYWDGLMRHTIPFFLNSPQGEQPGKPTPATCNQRNAAHPV